MAVGHGRTRRTPHPGRSQAAYVGLRRRATAVAVRYRLSWRPSHAAPADKSVVCQPRRTPDVAGEEVSGDARPLGTRGVLRMWLPHYVHRLGICIFELPSRPHGAKVRRVSERAPVKPRMGWTELVRRGTRASPQKYQPLNSVRSDDWQHPRRTGTSSNRSLPTTGTGLSASILGTITATMIALCTRCLPAGTLQRWAISNTGVCSAGRARIRSS